MSLKRYALAAIFLCSPAFAQWPAQEYKAEYDSCVPSCDKNNPTRHDKCVSYCHCVMDSLQSKFPDHRQIERDFTAKVPATITEVQGVANTCNRRTFGGDARPLK